MMNIDREGVILRDPHYRKMKRRPPVSSAGPNEVWLYEGYEGLHKHGFSIWGIRDNFSGKWFGLWCLPASSDKSPVVAAYLWLSVVQEVCGESYSTCYFVWCVTLVTGMPSEDSAHDGAESNVSGGLANALQ